MYAAPFEYVRASSWSEAVQRLSEGGEDARVIAGGQSLVPMMMLRLAEPPVLVDIGGADERTIERANGALVLSALARHVDLQWSPVVHDACPVLAEAAGHIGNVRVRHRGTIGGSLAHAEPTAELPCLAVALGASVRTLGPDGERTILADELCTGARLVVGATADRPTDVSSAAEPLIGEEPTERAAHEAGRAAAEALEIGPSTHASAGYRQEVVGVLAERALLTAAAPASGTPEQDGDAR